MGDGCLNNEHFEELGGILKGKLEEHFKNQELRQGETSLQPPLNIITKLSDVEQIVICQRPQTML